MIKPPVTMGTRITLPELTTDVKLTLDDACAGVITCSLPLQNRTLSTQIIHDNYPPSWSIVLLVKRLNASKTVGIIIRPLNSIERPKLCSWFEIGLKGWRWCWDTDSWFPTTRPISILIIWLFPFWKGYEETCGWEWNAGNMITTNHWSVSIN